MKVQCSSEWERGEGVWICVPRLHVSPAAGGARLVVAASRQGPGRRFRWRWCEVGRDVFANRAVGAVCGVFVVVVCMLSKHVLLLLLLYCMEDSALPAILYLPSLPAPLVPS